MLILFRGPDEELFAFFVVGTLFGVVVGIFVDAVHTVFKALDTFTDALHQFGDFLAPKEQQDNKRKENDLASTDITKE